MTFSLSKALRLVCYLWALVGLVLIGLGVYAVETHRYKDPVAFFAGAFSGFFALVLFALSRTKTASQTTGRSPVLAVILWLVAVVFGIWGIWGLFNILVQII
jgi:uncharacterized membrane protein